LTKNYEGTTLADVFARLADQERCHKQTLEKEYEDRFLQWM
jgi:rubrerythrin